MRDFIFLPMLMAHILYPSISHIFILSVKKIHKKPTFNTDSNKNIMQK
jgi:hypothetical protein